LDENKKLDKRIGGLDEAQLKIFHFRLLVRRTMEEKNKPRGTKFHGGCLCDPWWTPWFVVRKVNWDIISFRLLLRRTIRMNYFFWYLAALPLLSFRCTVYPERSEGHSCTFS